LRLLLIHALERIEVAIRVQLAYQIRTHGGFAYLDRSKLGKQCDALSRNSPTLTQYDEFLIKLNNAVQHSSETFARHHRERYGNTIPIWVAIELWDFGMLSRFFQFLNVVDREAVTATFSLDRHKTLVSWLESLNLLRKRYALTTDAFSSDNSSTL
jgi:abortive infection bacteriophage resistance protein